MVQVSVPEAFVAVIVIVPLPAAVGVPLIEPSASSVGSTTLIPAGTPDIV